MISLLPSARPCLARRALARLTPLLVALALEAPARAEPARIDPTLEEPAREGSLAGAPTRDEASRGEALREREPDLWAHVRRPWLLAADPTAPPQGHAVTSLAVGYAPLDRDAARPFAADIAHVGAVFTVGAEVGLLRFLSLRADGSFAGQGDVVSAGAMISANVYPLDPAGPVQVAVSAGYLRELGGDNGVFGRLAVAGDIGRARLILTALGEHVFAPTGPAAPPRDSVDVVITAGVTYAVTSALRLGVEYVAQDLEGIWDDEEAEGGVRHFVGPVASFALARQVQLTAGPAFGLSPGAPSVLGRLAASYAF